MSLDNAFALIERHPGVKIPVWFLGMALYGRLGTAVFAALTAAHVVGAIGLLRTKLWALYTIIVTEWLAALNIVLMIAIPANRAKYEAMVKAMTISSTPSQAQTPVTVAWIGVLASLPILVIILWFLISGREAFVAAQKSE